MNKYLKVKLIMNKILYFGNFNFKKGFAACNRVIGNCVVLNKLGFSTIIYGKNVDIFAKTSFAIKNNICCIEKSKSKISDYINANNYLNIIKNTSDLEAIFLYNFPSIPFIKILRYCHKKKIKIYSDVTEWYSTKGTNFIFKPFKFFDTFLRMRVLNKRCDGLICISNNLMNFYKNVKNKIKVYPIMDYVLWEAECFKYKKIISEQKNVITLIGRNILAKDDLSLFSSIEKRNFKINIVGMNNKETKKMIGYPLNPNIHLFPNPTREDIFSIYKETTFNYIIRKPTKSNNAGFPSKLAESLVLDTPVIYSYFSDLKELSDIYSFGIEKESFVNGNIKAIKIDNRIKNMFRSINYLEDFSSLLKICDK